MGVRTEVQAKRQLVIVGASATFSKPLDHKLTEVGAVWSRCTERPHPVEVNAVELQDEDSRYQVAIGILHTLVILKSGTVLVFYPGKHEINTARASLRTRGFEDRLCRQARASQ